MPTQAQRKLNARGWWCAIFWAVSVVLTITLIAWCSITISKESSKLHDCFVLNYTCDADNAVLALNLKIDEVDADRIFHYNVTISRYCTQCCDEKAKEDYIDESEEWSAHLQCLLIDENPKSEIKEVKCGGCDGWRIVVCVVAIIFLIVLLINNVFCGFCIVCDEDDKKYYTDVVSQSDLRRASQRSILTCGAKSFIVFSFVWCVAFVAGITVYISVWHDSALKEERCEFYGNQCDVAHETNTMYFKLAKETYGIYAYNVTIPTGCEKCCDDYSPFGDKRDGYCIFDDENKQIVDIKKNSISNKYTPWFIVLLLVPILLWGAVIFCVTDENCNLPYTKPSAMEQIYRDVELIRVDDCARPTALDEEERSAKPKASKKIADQECFICLRTTEGKWSYKNICACKTQMVHRSCLQKWKLTARDPEHCPTCRTEWKK